MRLGRSWWSSPVVHVALLAVVCLGIYSNNFHHDFQLDDKHVLTDNLAIRSLANIPKYFVDPGTFTSLRANVDYRPVLQITYAVNYRQGGYDTWWWHLTQILLHFACVVGLYALCRRIIVQTPALSNDEACVAYVPLAAALIFAVHPTASGVVNYLSARSSLLTAAFLLPSIVLYMVPRNDARYRRTPWLVALLFALAIFSKVEAIGCLAVYFLYDVWQTADERGHGHSFLSDLRASLNTRTLRRLWPMLAVAVVYFVVRRSVMAPFEFDQARRATDVTAMDYLLTQTVVWWRYVFNWLAPVKLIADQNNFPIYRSVVQGPVALAIAAWLVVGAGLVASWKRSPYLTFLTISAFALLSPTSSIAPLAEMLNEHRPYLPVAILSLCVVIPCGVLAIRAARETRIVAPTGAVAVTGLLLVLGTLTYQRNRVFATTRSYLEDLVAKAPSGRALNNYGLLFLQAGNYPKALETFTAAERYTPAWHIVHINLAIVYAQLGDLERATQEFDAAVKYDQFSGTALAFRGEYEISWGKFHEAIRDFESAAPKSLELYRLCKGLATAYAGVGDAQRSFEHTRDCMRLDSAQTVLDAPVIAKPFLNYPALASAGLAYFEQFDKLLPDTWFIQHNIETLADRIGDRARAEAAHTRAVTLMARR